MRKSAVSLLVLLATACQGGGPTARRASPPIVAPETMEITSLETSVDSLRDEFNGRDGQARVVVLLSSTEGPCALGARAVRESVLESYPDADLWVGVVWVDMQPGDCGRSVALAARRFVDERVQHFHDPSKRAGRAFAVGLLPTGVAWDVYLFYPPGARWIDDPPQPLTWSHQLGRIDPEHFHPREVLFQKLHEATAAVLAAGSAPAPKRAALPPPERTRWAGVYPPGT
ncbi:MAG: hypothetical protein ACI8QZ_002289 [Chlamydiales bacterium]|jgi:hypothetical protein